MKKNIGILAAVVLPIIVLCYVCVCSIASASAESKDKKTYRKSVTPTKKEAPYYWSHGAPWGTSWGDG